MPLVISGNVVKGWRPNALSDGNVALPAISFNNSTSTGVYHAGNGTLAFSSNGVQVANMTSSALSITKDLAIGGGTSSAVGLGPWVPRFSATDNNWSSVAWSPLLGLYAAVAYSGTGNRVMTSTDGITWLSRTSASDINWTYILWVSELKMFVAVGTGAASAMTSYDGVTWTLRTLPATLNWYGLAWSPSLSLLVAVAASGSGNRFATSPDGITWTTRTSPADNNWLSVAWSPSLSIFVAVASSGTGAARVATSTNGTAWTLRNAASDNDWISVCWSDTLGLFVAVSATGTGNRVMSSVDGINWTSRVSAADLTWKSVIWAGGLSMFIAVAYTGAGNRTMYSRDGITWSSRSSSTSIPQDTQYLGLAYSPELQRVVAVGDSGSGSRVTSADLYSSAGSAEAPPMKFSTRANIGMFSPAANTMALTAGGVETMHVGSSGIAVNPSIVTDMGPLTVRTASSANQWNGLAWSPQLKLFAACSYTGGTDRIMTSGDGITWTTRSTPNNNWWLAVTWSSTLNIFCAVASTGTGNRVMTSGDGISWVARSSAADVEWRDVIWSAEKNLFVAVARTGTAAQQIMTSPDGTTWTSRTAPSASEWYSVTYSPQLGLFVSVAYSGTSRVMTSSDGINWVGRVSANETLAWRTVTWAPELGIFCAVSQTGTGNRVMTSVDGVNWVPRASAADAGWNSIAWSPELRLFIVVAYSGSSGYRCMVSKDGITWSLRATPSDIQYTKVAWAPSLGRFAAVSDSATTATVVTADTILTETGGNATIAGNVAIGQNLVVGNTVSKWDASSKLLVTSDSYLAGYYRSGMYFTNPTAGFGGLVIDHNDSYGNQAWIDGSSDLLKCTFGGYAALVVTKYLGRVGIGTAAPVCSLHVTGTTSQAIPAHGYLSTSGANTYNTTATPGDVTAYFAGACHAITFRAISDKRIKKNIAPLQNGLEKLKLLQPVTYQHIDHVTKGTAAVVGFVAQDVAEHFPEAIGKQREAVPDIYTLCPVDLESSSISVAGALKSGDLVVHTLAGEKTLQVTATEHGVHFEPGQLVESDLKDGQVFVFGYKVDDFHVLDKNALFTINVAATQELDAKVQALEARLAAFERAMEP